MLGITQYLKDVAEELLKLLFVALSAAGVNCVLLYGSWYFWQVFLSTHSGDMFEKLHPERFDQLKSIFSLEPYWETALQLAGISALFMLVVALICQFIYIRHLLYMPLWGVLKISWAIGLSFALAWLIQHYGFDYGFKPHLSDYLYYVALLLPSMACMLFPSMKSAPRIVPDVVSLFVSITSRF
ncbi:MAG: hypothetical protein Q9M22_00765 [Mariprofundaceae bacterium]|nr:hypothetical protein [Mariprofundaceae bacterium]